MLLGILETGRPPPEIAETFPDYPAVFEALIAPVAPDWRFKTYPVLLDEFPTDVAECDAWLVTGSKSGAYDDDPWIKRLQQFLREAYDGGVPIAGICFGHQLLAQALGGKVVKSDKGWGVGVHDYQLAPTWPGPLPGTVPGVSARESFSIQAFHQDQVVEVPADASVHASSDFCPNALMTYAGDGLAYRAITFQGHPEFDGTYARALIETRRGHVVPEAVSDRALATCGRSVHQRWCAEAIVAYVRLALNERQAARETARCR